MLGVTIPLESPESGFQFAKPKHFMLGYPRPCRRWAALVPFSNLQGAHRCAIFATPAPRESSALNLEPYPHRSMVTGVYFAAHPAVYAAVHESV